MAADHNGQLSDANLEQKTTSLPCFGLLDALFCLSLSHYAAIAITLVSECSTKRDFSEVLSTALITLPAIIISFNRSVQADLHALRSLVFFWSVNRCVSLADSTAGRICGYFVAKYVLSTLLMNYALRNVAPAGGLFSFSALLKHFERPPPEPVDYEHCALPEEVDFGSEQVLEDVCIGGVHWCPTSSFSNENTDVISRRLKSFPLAAGASPIAEHLEISPPDLVRFRTRSKEEATLLMVNRFSRTLLWEITVPFELNVFPFFGTLHPNQSVQVHLRYDGRCGVQKMTNLYVEYIGFDSETAWGFNEARCFRGDEICKKVVDVIFDNCPL